MEVFGDSDMRKGSGHSQGGLIPGPGEQAVWARPDRGMWRDRVLTAERDEEAAES